MKFITITPSKYMQDALLTSDTTLVLAHLIEEGNEYWKGCLKFKKLGGKLIMDNSFYELKRNMEIEKLVKKANLINANTLVLPDIPYRDNFSFIIKHTIKRIRELGYKGKFMATIFANNRDFKKDLYQFKALNEIGGVDIISIPYSFDEEFAFQRPKFLDLIEKKVGVRNIKKHIHLFGCNSLENLKKEKRSWVKSIDGTLPWKCGYYKLKLPIPVEKDPKRPKNYFDIANIDREQRDIIIYNLKYIKEVCENETQPTTT